jgi:hypothetical protein
MKFIKVLLVQVRFKFPKRSYNQLLVFGAIGHFGVFCQAGNDKNVGLHEK